MSLSRWRARFAIQNEKKKKNNKEKKHFHTLANANAHTHIHTENTHETTCTAKTVVQQPENVYNRTRRYLVWTVEYPIYVVKHTPNSTMVSRGRSSPHTVALPNGSNRQITQQQKSWETHDDISKAKALSTSMKNVVISFAIERQATAGIAKAFILRWKATSCRFLSLLLYKFQKYRVLMN